MEREARAVASGGATSERLQALLARAAQEQLTEQRQVSAVLADLHELVAGVGRRVDAVRDDLAALTARLDGLADRVEAGGPAVVDVAAASEQRLREHVDEAVLALAQVLLPPRRGAVAADGPLPEEDPSAGGR